MSVSTYFALFALVVASWDATSANVVIKNRILGGNEANPGQFPFICIIVPQFLHCGATILNENFVLTAAHCVYFWDDFQVKCGKVNQYYEEDDEQVRDATYEDVFVHENFNSMYLEGSAPYDIALVRLNDPLVFTDKIQSINMAYPDFDYSSFDTATTLGWGAMDPEMTEISEILRHAEMSFVPIGECAADEDVQFEGFNLDNTICTRPHTGALCGGDSGSPLVLETTEGYIQVGIALWSVRSCDINDGIAGYVGISYHYEWIENKMIAIEASRA